MPFGTACVGTVNRRSGAPVYARLASWVAQLVSVIDRPRSPIGDFAARRATSHRWGARHCCSWEECGPNITAAHYLALTVTDVEGSAAGYRDLLGLIRVFDGSDDTVRFHVLAHPDSGWVMGVRHYTAGGGNRFDEPDGPRPRCLRRVEP
jgi:hypothetical protein